MASIRKDRKNRADQSAKKMTYRTSSFCNYGECIAVGVSASGSIAIKDTKASGHKALLFTSEEWQAFVKGIKNGDFDQLSHG